MKHAAWILQTAVACLGAYWAMGDIPSHQWLAIVIEGIFTVAFTIAAHHAWERRGIGDS